MAPYSTDKSWLIDVCRDKITWEFKDLPMKPAVKNSKSLLFQVRDLVDVCGYFCTSVIIPGKDTSKQFFPKLALSCDSC